MRTNLRLKERSRLSEGTRQLSWRVSETLAPLKPREIDTLNKSAQGQSFHSNRLTPLTIRKSFTKLKSHERSKSAINPVYDFLENCGMEQHYKAMAESGIEELDSLREMNDSKLSELNIPLGHRIKIMKRLRSSSTVPPSEKKDEVVSTNKKIPVSNAKTACWKCFRVFMPENAFSFLGKEFCSQRCKEKYVLERSVVCTCGKSVVKNNAHLYQGQWICLDCASDTI